MSEIPEDINSSFKTHNFLNRETLQGERDKFKIKRKNVLISVSPNKNNVNSSIENKENGSSNINSNNMINNKSTVPGNFSAFMKEPQVVPESENPSILLQEHLKQNTYQWPELSPKVCKLPDKQLLPGKSENSSPNIICSRKSYAEALKLNMPSNSTSYHNIEVKHRLKNIQEKNSRLNKEVNYLLGDNENPFGVIGRNVVDRKVPKILSKFQTDFSCYSNDENPFLKDEFSHTTVLPDFDIELNSIFEETKGLNNLENGFRNEFSNEHNLRQEYSCKTDLLNVEKFDIFFKKVTDRELLSHIPKLSDGNKTYIDQCAMSTNALIETHNFRYPLNINWNNDSSSCGTCIKTLRTDILSLNQYTGIDSPSAHDSSYTTQVEVIPNEHVEVFSNSFLSNTLKICGTTFISEHPVLFIPLYQGLMQDAEAQETNLLASPTHCEIESELSELWKEKSEKSVYKYSKNASHPKGQESGCENKQEVQGIMEGSQFGEKMQQLLNCNEVNTSHISDSSTVIASCLSSTFTEKGFNCTEVTNPPSEDISDACVQKINDRLSDKLSSILNASNIIIDFNSSYDFYKSVRYEVNQKIEEINQRISLLSETLNL